MFGFNFKKPVKERQITKEEEKEILVRLTSIILRAATEIDGLIDPPDESTVDIMYRSVGTAFTFGRIFEQTNKSLPPMERYFAVCDEILKLNREGKI